MCDHVLVAPSLTFTIHSDLASFIAEDDLKKELQRHFGIFFEFLSLQLKESLLLLLLLKQIACVLDIIQFSLLLLGI